MIPVPRAGLEIGRGAPGGFPCSDSPWVPKLPFVSDCCVLLDCEFDREPVDSGRFCCARATPTREIQADSPAHKIHRNTALGVRCICLARIRSFSSSPDSDRGQFPKL